MVDGKGQMSRLTLAEGWILWGREEEDMSYGTDGKMDMAGVETTISCFNVHISIRRMLQYSLSQC